MTINSVVIDKEFQNGITVRLLTSELHNILIEMNSNNYKIVGINGFAVSKNGVEGALFRSNINGNSIFMPATGFCEGDKRFNDGSIGCYYSSSLYALPATYKYTSRAYYIYFNEFDVPKWYSDYGYRYYGRAVRPVSP